MSRRVPATLRALVQERALHRCDYCLIHEEDVAFPHEPDHVIARKHRGSTQEENLVWACFFCNRFKGTDLASVDLETGRIERLFNPRIDRWEDHFRLEEAYIVPLTPQGRVTEYLLHLNQPDQVKFRQLLITAGRYPR